MIIELSRRMRGLNGRWRQHSTPFLRHFIDIDDAIVWASAEMRGLRQDRFDIFVNDRIVAAVYGDGNVTRFGGSDDQIG